MTNLPEAKLAREAELCYATLALVTDYDCWYEGEETVTVEVIVATLRKNVETAKQVLRAAVLMAGEPRQCACGTALTHAVLTDPRAITASARRRLGLLLRRTLSKK
jgi:5'-methylthioadenosine phosphorylase